MNIRPHQRSLIELHVAVFLLGFAGLFGKFIHVDPIVIVFGRVLFASIALLIFLSISKQSLRLATKKDIFGIVALGAVLAFHWTTFFYSIQLSTVAIGLLSFSSFPIFTTLLEPIVTREKIRFTNLGIACLTLVGIYFALPKIDVSDNATKGALWGLVAGFTCAIVVIGNRIYVQKYSSIVIAFYEDVTATIVVAPLMFFVSLHFTAKNVGLLLLLGVVFTAGGHVLLIKGTTHVSAQIASVIGSLEVIYGIVFAAILLNEKIYAKTIVGAVIVVSATALATSGVLEKRKKSANIAEIP